LIQSQKTAVTQGRICQKKAAQEKKLDRAIITAGTDLPRAFANPLR
jgi:hypothetical protein